MAATIGGNNSSRFCLVICGKKQKHCLPEELETGDCWIALSLAQPAWFDSRALVWASIPTLLAQSLVSSTEGKTDCSEWHTDGWDGYERVLPVMVDHYISKALTQRLERTNGIVRQQTGRWHRRQNMRDCGRNPSPRNSRKFGKVWQQTELTVRLVLSYFNWIWRHSCGGNYSRTASRVNRSTLDLE